MTGRTSSELSGAATFRLVLPYMPMNWNEYIGRERGSKYAANNIKQAEKQIVESYCRLIRNKDGSPAMYTGGYPAQVTIRPHFSAKRADLDNTRYKGIIDGLVSCGVIQNDNLKHIQRIVLEPIFDDIEAIEIIIEPLKPTICYKVRGSRGHWPSCSVCDNTLEPRFVGGVTNFCPNCGARVIKLLEES